MLYKVSNYCVGTCVCGSNCAVVHFEVAFNADVSDCHFTAVCKVTAHIVTLGSNMSFVFDADKILSVVKSITGVASKLNSSASTINKLAEQFDGMKVGFELKKQ